MSDNRKLTISKKRTVSDRAMAVVLVFDQDVLRPICGYSPQIGRKYLLCVDKKRTLAALQHVK